MVDEEIDDQKVNILQSLQYVEGIESETVMKNQKNEKRDTVLLPERRSETG